MLLPKYAVRFISWFFLYVPTYLYKIGFRFLVLMNYLLAFTLSIRLIFTPYFHDTTFAGRLASFFLRIVKILFGLVVLSTILLLVLVIPLFWFFLPFHFLYFGEYISFLLLCLCVLLIYLVWCINTPLKIVSQSTPTTATMPLSFTYKVLRYLNTLSDIPNFFSKLFKDREILDILVRVEMADEEFINKVSKIKIDHQKLLQDSYAFAQEHASKFVYVEHLLLAVLNQIPNRDNFFEMYDSRFSLIEDTVKWILSKRKKDSMLHFWQEDYMLPKMGGFDVGHTGKWTPTLDAISEDFTKLAEYGQVKHIYAHKEEMLQAVELLSSSESNILLIGPPGCGKTSLVKGIALEMYKGTDNKALKFKRVVSLNVGGLIAGAKTAGEVSGKIQNVINEIVSSEDVVLFIDEIHNLIAGAAFEGSSTMFSLLEPHLAEKKIQFIGATNIESYRKYIEPNGSFSKLLNVIELSEATDGETIKILEGLALDYEKEYGAIITYSAIDETLKLGKKLIHERVFPDKAIDILHRAVATLDKDKKIVTREIIRNQVSELTHVPVTTLNADESEKLLNLESLLREKVIGQDYALSQVTKALQRARVGIRDESKPIANFLFVGTTGVGKTETAKALASTYFGSKDSLIRLDMSEYQQIDSINRLLGDPNSNTRGLLTDAVRNRPYSLILLDEIEKAHPNILLAFLQVLDDGRLTDSTGITADFSNSIIIATSNVGTKTIQEALRNNADENKLDEVAQTEVRNKFAPEFLNRFDGIIVFKPLSKESVFKIATIMLKKIANVAKEKSITLSFNVDLITALVERGYSVEWGARNLQRVIEDVVETYVAQRILKGELKSGDTITLGLEVFETSDKLQQHE